MSNIFKKILREKRGFFRLLFFLFFDVVFISLAVFLAFLLRFENTVPSQYFPNIEGMIILAVLISLPIFYFLKLYSFSWAYVSSSELISLVKAITLSFLFLTVVLFVLKDQAIFSGLPRSTIFISFVLVFIFSGAIRFAKRIYLEIFSKTKKEKEKTLIIGAGSAGEQILRNILSSKATVFSPVGFIDDDPGKQGILIHGIKVLGKIEDIPQVAARENIEGMIIALPSSGVGVIKRIVAYGRQAKLKKIKIVPSINEVNLGTLQEVAVEELLGREAVSLDEKSIENFIRNKRVLITGAAGSIGSELCRQLIKFEPQFLFLLDQDETGVFNISEEIRNRFPKIKFLSLIADITDEEKMEKIIRLASPHIVFHAAAYKHVPLMEAAENLDEAIKNNIFGTEILARICSRTDELEKFIFISTDKAVNPASVMGATKRAGEMICQALNQKSKTKFISVRFGNVLNSRGNVIQIFKEQIEKRKRGETASIEITHPEMKRYFMVTSEACLLVLQAGAMGEGGEVFVLDMGEPMKIIDLAKELIHLSGLEPDKDIPIIITQPRPGEKIFEEILSAEEGTVATRNQKIFRAKLSEVEPLELNLKLAELKKIVKSRNKEAIIKILKGIIPNYQPIN